MASELDPKLLRESPATAPFGSYQLCPTEDGSPTLVELQPDGYWESMHNRRGALGETLFIYGKALQDAVQFRGPLKVLNVGLGLGYHEILLATQVALARDLETKVYLESFEKDDFLVQNFLAWLGEERQEPYDRIAPQMAQELSSLEAATKIAASAKQLLKEWRRNGRWQIRGELNETTLFSTKFNLIFYDLFSARFDGKPWEEDFLVDLLRKAADSPCRLATYAAKGNLTRALKANGFSVTLHPGFQGKRQCTFATKI